MNAVVKVTHVGHGDVDAVIVRIHTALSGLLRQDLGSLATVMGVVAAGGVGAPLLAEFNNGLVYGFTPGEMLNPDIHTLDQHIQSYAFIYLL